MTFKLYKLPFAVFIFTIFLLSVIQIKSGSLFVAERFIKGGGWIEVFLIGLYGFFIAFKMQNPAQAPKWRKRSWTLFSIIFFSQLILGISGLDKFLMTGKLHLPIPMMIMAGPLYRGHLSVMTILFLSTIFLAGPSWCSHLCYFGAFDNIAASKNRPRGTLKHKAAIKSTILLLIIAAVILLRWFNVSILVSTIAAITFGIVGIGVMILLSRKKGKMIHCVLYCPIGSVVNIAKHVNPFRMYIDQNCTLCMKCTTHCNYDALNIKNIQSHKPGMSCTYCGDCLHACKEESIKYRFFKMKPENARLLYLFITISLHAVFLATARI